MHQLVSNYDRHSLMHEYNKSLTKLSRWPEYFFKVAKVLSEQSKDPSLKVACILVNQDNRIISTGYNGFPSNGPDPVNGYSNREFKLPRVIHAEANALLYAGTAAKGSKAFIYPLSPCLPCSSLLSQAGITEVHHPLNVEYEAIGRWAKSLEEAYEWLHTYGIKTFAYELEEV